MAPMRGWSNSSSALMSYDSIVGRKRNVIIE
jgi:hypothetical protein